MKLRLIAMSILLVSTLHAGAAAEKGLKVAMEVERDGQSVAKPSIWQPSGTTGEISMKDEFRLKITPTLVDDKADVRFEIFTTQGGVESTAGAPRIITKIGQRASLAWNTASGKNYRISVLVSESEKPVR